MVQEAVAKLALPTFSFYKWHEWSSDYPKRINLEKFYSWLEARARYLENAHLSSTINQTGTDNVAVARHIKYLQTYTRELQSISANVTAREGKCHPQTKLCFGCLRSNHLAKNCNRKVKCGIDG